ESPAEGLDLLRQGLADWDATGSVTYRTYYLALLAEVLGAGGSTGEALAALAEALQLAQQTGERYYEAELHRLRGEFLLKSALEPAAEAEAEGCFRRALAVAGGQGARSLELRSALSLARLYRAQGKAEEGRELLAPIYGWFTEGLDTPDLQQARALLEA